MGYDYNTLLSSKHPHIPHPAYPPPDDPPSLLRQLHWYAHPHLSKHPISPTPFRRPVFELPANLFTKWFGPGKAIPLYTIIFGVLSIAMGFVKNFGASLAVRFLLGCVRWTGGGRGMTGFANARDLQCG